MSRCAVYGSSVCFGVRGCGGVTLTGQRLSDLLPARFGHFGVDGSSMAHLVGSLPRMPWVARILDRGARGTGRDGAVGLMRRSRSPPRRVWPPGRTDRERYGCRRSERIVCASGRPAPSWWSGSARRRRGPAGRREVGAQSCVRAFQCPPRPPPLLQNCSSETPLYLDSWSIGDWGALPWICSGSSSGPAAAFVAIAAIYPQKVTPRYKIS